MPYDYGLGAVLSQMIEGRMLEVIANFICYVLIFIPIGFLLLFCLIGIINSATRDIIKKFL